MTRSILVKGALLAVTVPLLACNLLKVTDNEDSNSGRGAKLHDPYQSLNSGAVRLSLQYFNGCAILANGQAVKKNSVTVPYAYPDKCADLLGLDSTQLTSPTGTLKLVANTKYFLNQFTITDSATGQHTNLTDAARWITTQSTFRSLDWSNLGTSPEEFSFSDGAGLGVPSWNREIHFTNANWEKVKDDTFLIEMMDRDGVVRASQEYPRSSLLVSTSYAGHSRFSWRIENVLAPRFPGDTEARPVETPPGGLPQPITYRTFARMDLVGSTDPFKTITVPADLLGEGLIRVTWSQMKDKPFYFPATFESPDALPVTCTDDQGQAKQCTFGLDPRLTFAPPKDGSFYKPGETVNMYVDLRDGAGNHLHPPELLPSGTEIVTDQANGLLTLIPGILLAAYERDAISNVAVAGPIQKMTVAGDPTKPAAFNSRPFPFPVYPDETLVGLVPGLIDVKFPTRQSYKLPVDAEPGTYVAMVKFSRYFRGERITKMTPFYFQVGQDETTNFPNAVGNCQICHKGVLSLDNLRHGLAVDHVEACKTCHHYDNDGVGRAQETIHQIHIRSPRYMAAKNDCTMCHLTRESAIRPSITVCGSCHPSTHDSKYFEATFSPKGELNRFGNCAQSCHGDTTPLNHILPPQN